MAYYQKPDNYFIIDKNTRNMKNLTDFIAESLHTANEIITEASLAKMPLGEYESKDRPFQIVALDINSEPMMVWWVGLDDLKHIKTKKQLFKELIELSKIAIKEAKRKAKEDDEDYEDYAFDIIALHNGDYVDCPALAVVWPVDNDTDFYEFEPYYNKNAEFHGYAEKEDFEGPEKEALSAFLASLK